MNHTQLGSSCKIEAGCNLFFSSDSNNFPVRYDINKKALIGGQGSKVRKLLKLKLVEMLDACHFKVHPIEGYNSTTYDVIIDMFKQGCTCQYNRLYGKECAHILAAKAYYNIMTGGIKQDE
jgi:hypothetical protein